MDAEGNAVLEETTAFEVAYRHFWNDNLRSTIYYGKAETDVEDEERVHWGLNLFTNLTPKLTVGAEVGNYEVADSGAESDYLQFSAKYSF
jgi:hypothetical protein